MGIEAETLEIWAIEVTGNGVGDASILPELLMELPADEPVATATLDGAYDTQGCYAALVGRGIMPVIPPRKNAKPWKSKITGREVPPRRAVGQARALVYTGSSAKDGHR